jgi:hypothetical protein
VLDYPARAFAFRLGVGAQEIEQASWGWSLLMSLRLLATERRTYSEASFYHGGEQLKEGRGISDEGA